ncbi:MAG TPA: hypothetical protein VGP77_09595 [Vicinamibacterales bacterium]|nr:hypothetical protein [Vicinamibacterales bacterium]
MVKAFVVAVTEAAFTLGARGVLRGAELNSAVVSPILRPALHLLFVVALATGLGACGGGGDSGPPRESTTPATRSPDLSGPLGLTQLSDFPTLGFAYRWTYTSNSDGWQSQGPSTPDPTDIISFSYSTADQTYQIAIPGLERERLVLQHETEYGSSYSFRTAPSLSFYVFLSRPGAANSELPLAYTSSGEWDDPIYFPGTHSVNTGYFAYGVPTEPGDVPVSGSRTYKAGVSGRTSAGGPMDVWWVFGTANLTFDFSNGALTGNLNLGVNPGGPGHQSYGIFPFASTNYTVGATRFSGKFSMPGGVEDGFFEGQFTGPQASELMVRWLLPKSVGPTGSLFGVLVGSRQSN